MKQAGKFDYHLAKGKKEILALAIA